MTAAVKRLVRQVPPHNENVNASMEPTPHLVGLGRNIQDLPRRLAGDVQTSASLNEKLNGIQLTAGFQSQRFKPKGKAAGSVIMLAPWAGEQSWWKEWLGVRFKELLKMQCRVIVGVGKEYEHPDAIYRGWFSYENWQEDIPIQSELDTAVAYVNGLIEQEYRVVQDYRRIVLVGYSQGAALALETGVRFAQPIGLVFSQRGILMEQRLKNVSHFAATPYIFTAGADDNEYWTSTVKEHCDFCRKQGASCFFKVFSGLDHYRCSQRENSLLIRAVSAVISRKSIAALDVWD